MPISKMLLCFISFLLSLPVAGQPEPSIAERLGYEKDAKLLILHADDAGVAHAVNLATISAITRNAVSSLSIMAPCPWFMEMAAYLKAHPNVDAGIHLTLTSEWRFYKWAGVASPDKIPSLLNEQGYFYDNVSDVVNHARPAEVETELRAQIERARTFGIRLTHLDSHMGTLFAKPEFFRLYLMLGKEYKLPVFLPANLKGQNPELGPLVGNDVIWVDHLAMMNLAPEKEHWLDFYTNIVEQLKPGVNEIIVHLALDNAEMKAVTYGHREFGAEWRKNDYNTVTNPTFQQVLKLNNVHLITWGQIRDLMYPNH